MPASNLPPKHIPPSARTWRPAPLLYLSALWHALACFFCLVLPAYWYGWLALIAANHLLICVLVLLPRNALLGENHTRLCATAKNAIALTFDDGPDPEVTPQVLKILAHYQARASFFCIGQRVQKYPELAQSIIAHGHTIENHGYRHPHTFAFLGPQAIRQEINTGSEVIFACCGRWPRFFRAPAGFRNPWLDYVLASLGLRLTSWTRRGFDTRCANTELVLSRLRRALKAGDLLLLHDGNSARNAQGVPVVLEVLPRLLEDLQTQQLKTVCLSEEVLC